MTTWVVSGMPRSGTSMMMRALATGGLDPFLNEEKDRELEKIVQPRYHPNPNGYYEPGSHRNRRDFPRLIKGKLVKLMGQGPSEPRFRSSAPMRVVWMWRDPAEIAMSHSTTFNREPPWADEAHYDTIARARIARQESVPWIQDVTVIRYGDVTDPETGLAQFERLAEIGWLIDPAAAYATIDPALHRHRADG